MTFEEKLRRNDPLDQIEIGQIVDTALQGEFGILLRCIISGIVAEQLSNSRRNPQLLSADRALGRIEALDILTDRLDVIVDIKNQLSAEMKAEEEIKPSDQSPPTA
jgi:hypothetical protein